MLHLTKTACMTALFGALACAAQLTSAQEFYKWVDQKGSTHYTTTPPPKNAKKLSKVDTYGTRQNTQVKTAPPSVNGQNNQPAQSQATMDAQQQEANAALQQGLNRR